MCLLIDTMHEIFRDEIIMTNHKKGSKSPNHAQISATRGSHLIGHQNICFDAPFFTVLSGNCISLIQSEWRKFPCTL